MRNFDTTETILNRIVIFVKKPITIEPKFAKIFHGKTELLPERYFYSFRVTDYSKARLVTQFKKLYGNKLDITFAYGGTKVM